MNTVIAVDRIKQTVKKNGYTMKFLCSTIGVRDNYFTDCKHRNADIPEDILRQVSAFLGVSSDFLCGDTDDPRIMNAYPRLIKKNATPDPEPTIEDLGMTTYPYDETGKRPIFGQASAGYGVLAVQEVLGYEAVEPKYDNERYFWLQVAGDSMSPVLNDGDLVLVERDYPPEHDKLMVLVVDDAEGFIKKVTMVGDTITLNSYNPYYPPRVFAGAETNRIRFIGRVIEMKRKF